MNSNEYFLDQRETKIKEKKKNKNNTTYEAMAIFAQL
jgi:hypothetical protein